VGAIIQLPVKFKRAFLFFEDGLLESDSENGSFWVVSVGSGIGQPLFPRSSLKRKVKAQLAGFVGQRIDLFENCPLAERPSQQSRLHTNSIANRHIWRLRRKEVQGLPLCRLDEVVASATREITMHFDFDLVSVTLARGARSLEQCLQSPSYLASPACSKIVVRPSERDQRPQAKKIAAHGPRMTKIT
jgi:hypothetical protein